MLTREMTQAETGQQNNAPAQGAGWVAIVMMAVALIYALLAGLRTIADFDLGWQLATGRWIVEHHAIPSTDVFSYTAAGQPWIYPVGSGLLFYAIYLLGGYALLSWLGSVACAGTAALLLRRGSVLSFALVVCAVPVIALRTAPRADMFTVLLFAAFLRLLWRQHESGRAPLWLLPILMTLWVNLHLGFIAGMALLGGYVGIELLEALAERAKRKSVGARLRHAWPWLIATCFATLLNPWGWNIYRAIFRQEAAMALHSQAIMEWSAVHLGWASFLQDLAIRDSRGAFSLLLLVTAVALPLALYQKRLGALVLLGGGAFLVFRHIRFVALFAIIVAIVGGAVLERGIYEIKERIRDRRILGLVGAAAVLFITAICVIRSVDLVTDRAYLANSEISSFGPGLSWWLPEGAAAFLEQTNPPGEIFNSYNEGGYFVWRLGQKYRDYIDGRAIPFGKELMDRNGKLTDTPPDSPEWQQEAQRYHIDSIIVPLGRYFGVRAFPAFRQFCSSDNWVPVYLDETSGVFMRNIPETRQLIERYRVRCGTVMLPAKAPRKNGSVAYNQWSNAAAVLHQLGRDPEALEATNRANEIFPDSGYLHFLRGEILSNLGNFLGAEQAYLRATELQPNEVDWSALARLYQREGRFVPAMEAWERAAQLSGGPAVDLLSLGYAALDAHRPKEALQAFDRASAAFQKENATSADNSFPANLAHGRALAWATLGDLSRAVQYEEETVRLTPDRSDDWLQLSGYYLSQGRIEDAKRARERARPTVQTNHP